jgi:hypothetical protein
MASGFLRFLRLDRAILECALPAAWKGAKKLVSASKTSRKFDRWQCGRLHFLNSSVPDSVAAHRDARNWCPLPI